MFASLFDRRSVAPQPALQFATFWHGPLDPLIRACLASFPHHGLRLRLYSYARDPGLPEGVEHADARAIVADESLVGRYKAEGRTSLAPFSNLFRYRMLRATGLCWVDADMLCLHPVDFTHDRFVFGRQLSPPHPHSINTAVLKLPQAHPLLDALIRRVEADLDIERPWGVNGPILMTELATTHRLERHARGIAEFYPLEPQEFWKLLLPTWRDWVAAEVMGSGLLHLWHENFRGSGYDKTAAPPQGSFLHEVLQQQGSLARFDRHYDEPGLRAALGTWIYEDYQRLG